MAYRTKVEVQTNGKVYAPGSILPTNMSKIDMDFLKKRKFIELVEIDERGAAADEIEEDDEDRADGDMFDEQRRNFTLTRFQSALTWETITRKEKWAIWPMK